MLEPNAGESGASQTGSVGSSPATTATLEPSSSGTTTQTGAGAGTQTEPKGPIPYERFDEVNTKYNALNWAEGLDQNRTKQQSQFFQWLDADPEGAFKYMEDYLTRAGALKRQQQAQEATNQRPQPDVVVPETGQKFYSAEAAERLAQWIATQSTEPLEKRLQSIEGVHAQSRAAAQAQAQLVEANAWPYFKDNQPAILAAMEKDHRLSLEGAYNRVVVPKIRQFEREAVLKEINQKSQATTVNPASGGATGQQLPGKKLGFAEVFRREFAKRGA